MAFSPNPELVLKNQFGEESINAIMPGTTYGPLVSATVTLTAAQVIALNATPQTLIPAVTGKTIVVQAIYLSLVHGSAAFTIGSSKHLMAQYHTAAILAAQVAETGFLDHASSISAVGYGPGVGGLSLQGLAIELTSDDTTIAVGTGSTLAVTVSYQLI